MVKVVRIRDARSWAGYRKTPIPPKADDNGSASLPLLHRGRHPRLSRGHGAKLPSDG